MASENCNMITSLGKDCWNSRRGIDCGKRAENATRNSFLVGAEIRLLYHKISYNLEDKRFNDVKDSETSAFESCDNVILVAFDDKKPVILALSKSTSQSECTTKEAYSWTEGRAIYDSSNSFVSVEYNGKTFVPGQAHFVKMMICSWKLVLPLISPALRISSSLLKKIEKGLGGHRLWDTISNDYSYFSNTLSQVTVIFFGISCSDNITDFSSEWLEECPPKRSNPKNNNEFDDMIAKRNLSSYDIVKLTSGVELSSVYG
ncbi:NADP-dependent malic enzyme [Striga asiatica]|uniref:NADP-dependent malic enzyme n=1 Tax=Striga asiatica TaxID=4170 RepID=A0A5A7PM68_STRAF|nr:NADP-dependent malic enzyme [Striga asiatica]